MSDLHRLDRYAIRLLLALPPFAWVYCRPAHRDYCPLDFSITYLTYIPFFMLKSLVYIMSYIKSVSSVNFDTFNQRIAQPWDFVGLHNIALFAPPEYFFAAILFYIANFIGSLARETLHTTNSIYAHRPLGKRFEMSALPCVAVRYPIPFSFLPLLFSYSILCVRSCG